MIAGAEAEVWTERMLSALVNGVHGGKWFSLMDKVFAPKTLALASHRRIECIDASLTALLHPGP